MSAKFPRGGGSRTFFSSKSKRALLCVMALFSVMFLWVFVTFPYGVSVNGVVLDCIDS